MIKSYGYHNKCRGTFDTIQPSCVVRTQNKRPRCIMPQCNKGLIYPVLSQQHAKGGKMNSLKLLTYCFHLLSAAIIGVCHHACCTWRARLCACTLPTELHTSSLLSEEFSYHLLWAKYARALPATPTSPPPVSQVGEDSTLKA